MNNCVICEFAYDDDYNHLKGMCPDCNECFEIRFGELARYRDKDLIRIYKNEMFCTSDKVSKDSKYLVTFTTGTGVDINKWINHLNFEVKRKYVKSWKAVIEHKDSNVHCHIYMETSEYLKKGKHFKTYTKVFGYVDVKHIKKDNGIDNYFQKEGTVFNTGDIIVI